MKKITLGQSDLQVTPICLGTMTFGEQVAESQAHAILNRAVELGVNFLDTAEMYSVPAKAETCGATETILGHWFSSNPAMDESCHRLNVSLLAYSPLAFGALTGKYDQTGFLGEGAPIDARIGKYESVRKQRWGRESSLTAAKLYNQLARDNGMTPTQMALAFCYKRWCVASTIIGVTSVAQLEEDVKAWDTTLPDDVLAAIDTIRLVHRDPAT
jgi:aryl-alcohol dehydrogenase-like predicted oxidoreductase